ncbi:hypothetical protein ACO0SA_004292 [Hanseniaspora valbyensis]
MLKHTSSKILSASNIQKRNITFLKPLVSTAVSHFLFNKEIVAANQLEYAEIEKDSKTKQNTPITNETDSSEKLYPSHIPLNPISKGLVFLKSSIGSFTSPSNNININQLGETFPILSNCWLDYSYKLLLKDDKFDGRDILINKPDYRHILKDYLYVLEEPELYSKTLAYQMLQYLNKNKITLESREEVHYIDDINHQFVYNKYRQSHDFHHLIIGDLPTSIEGEIIIKLFEGINMGLPLGIIGGLLSPLHLKDGYIIRQLYTKYLSLIIDLNQKLKCNMLLINWSNYLLKDVDEIRYIIGGDDLVCFSKWIGDDVRELKKMRKQVVKKQQQELEEL